MRLCRYCLIEKEDTDFYDRSGGKRKMHKCKHCERERIYDWRQRNPEANKAIYTRGKLKSKYGLHPDEVIKFGTCQICERNDRRLVIDHCHTKGHVRGFICYNCNTLLGHLENKNKMNRIKEYLNTSLITSKYY